MTRIFFATDIHGSDICWKKFLNAGKFYGVDVLVLGGDMTGKALVPITQRPDGSYRAVLLQQEFILQNEGEVRDMERRVGSRGYYPFRVTPEQLAEFEADPAQVDAFFHQQMLATLERWMVLADEKLAGSRLRCFVCPGNDDGFEVDEVIRRSRAVELAEGKVMELGDGFQMVSTGWANITPWKTFRELPEAELAAKLEGMIPQNADMRRTVFAFHCPPYGSNLDEAPEVTEDLRVKEAGRALIPVGSTAVRDAILKYQPLLSLHGHIHEGKGIARLGKTLALNAGSLYEQGVLQGAVVDLDPRKGIRSYTLTTG
ncbi:MAG: metallophosphoesterase [Chloroflexi bacterium]|nr:metallophosphoesterase [Chloroflexota bacterium]